MRFIVVVLAGTCWADPMVADFEGLRHDDLTIIDVGSAYSEAGLLFTSSQTQPGTGFRTLGTQRPDFSGSTALYNGQSEATTTLTLLGGGAFRLFSLDITELPRFDENGIPVDDGPWDIEFVGDREDGSTVLVTFTKTGLLVPLELVFPQAFDSVVAVSWVQRSSGAGQSAHQFDNVRAAPVPEPMGLWLVAVAAALTLARTRRTSCR